MLVIAALRIVNDDFAKQIPARTLVLNREALEHMYGPTLVAWMRLLDKPEAPSRIALPPPQPL